MIGTLAKKRGSADSPFRVVERETVVYTLAPESTEVKKALDAAGITGEEIGSITPAMLKSGDWKKGTFRGYNIAIPPARIRWPIPMFGSASARSTAKGGSATG